MALPPWVARPKRGAVAGKAGREEMVVMMSGYSSGWPVWGIALMWIGMLAFLAFLIWAAYALITRTSRRARP